MPELLTLTTVQAALAVLVLCVLLASGYYLVSSFRDYAANDHHEVNDVLANLRELHSRGEISDEEFRTIQAKTNPKHIEKSSI